MMILGFEDLKPSWKITNINKDDFEDIEFNIHDKGVRVADIWP